MLSSFSFDTVWKLLALQEALIILLFGLDTHIVAFLGDGICSQASHCSCTMAINATVVLQ